jgi:hypothetical protein
MLKEPAMSAVLTYRKILIWLLVLNLLAGAYLILDMGDPSFFRVLLVVITVAISIFYLVVLITLINYVEYFEARIGRLQDRLIQLEKGTNSSGRISLPDIHSPTRPRGKLGDRLGRL